MKKSIRKYSERIIKAVLFSSSTVTTLTVLFIVIFLFREGIGLFRNSPLEKGFVIAVHPDNPLKQISSTEIGEIFNQDIRRWDVIGGSKDSIILFHIDDINLYYSDEELGDNLEFLPGKINEVILKEKGIIAFLPREYLPDPFAGHLIKVKNITIRDFIAGRYWYPTTQPVAQFGILPIILGTLWVSLGAILLSLPLGIAVAIYMAEIARPGLRQFMKPVVELLAGIPSVVYGFFGLIVIVPQIQKLFQLPVGETALAGSIVLAIMSLPTIITITEDAIRTVPVSMREASLALGATRWQTMVRVVIPYSISGITTAAILGIGRAMGETMAVLMVTGNASVIPHSFLQPVRTIPATIAAELGEAPFGGSHYQALFALGIILFLITLFINGGVEIAKMRNEARGTK